MTKILYMKKLMLFFVALMISASVPAFSSNKEKSKVPPSPYRHEIRVGWGDCLFENTTFHSTLTKTNYRYTGHIYAGYLYNLTNVVSVGGDLDFEKVSWDENEGTGTIYGKYFTNFSIIPEVRFTYFRRGIVTMYSGVGLGMNINGGSEIDYLGRKTVLSPVLHLNPFGINLSWGNNGRWFAGAEIGGLYALNNPKEIFMLYSRLLSVNVGIRL